MTAGLRGTTLDATHSPERPAQGSQLGYSHRYREQSSTNIITKTAGHKIMRESISEFSIGILLGGRLCKSLRTVSSTESAEVPRGRARKTRAQARRCQAGVGGARGVRRSADRGASNLGGDVPAAGRRTQ